jgi:hypothetical protein
MANNRQATPSIAMTEAAKLLRRTAAETLALVNHVEPVVALTLSNLAATMLERADDIETLARTLGTP